MRKLYTVPTANGQRASIALEECGLDYTVRPVDLFAGEHRNSALLKLNPFGRMPVLQINSESKQETIYGSLAIGMHAANASQRLLPAPEEFDAFNHWVGIIMTDLSPAFSGQFYLGTLAPEPYEWGTNWYAEIIVRFLTGIDRHLANNEYFLSAYSLVDVLMYPTAATSVSRMPQQLDPFPNIQRWSKQLANRPGVLRGMQASDAPKEPS